MSADKLLTGYRFLFYYGCVIKAGFQKISNIGGRIEVEYIHEGGNLDCAYPVKGAKTPSGKLTFEKGYGYYNPLLGILNFAAGSRIILPCSIFILDEDESIRRVLAFNDGLISSWESSPLDAGSNEILIDKVEIEHTGLFDIRL